MASRDGTMIQGLRQARQRLLPSGAGTFFHRRLMAFGGLLLALLGLVIFLACLTYNPQDPSLNNAGQDLSRNLLGVPGAIISDVLIQTLGLAAFLVPLALLAWGWRVVRTHGFSRWWLRLAALPFALVLMSMALATLPPPGSWLPETTLGGWAGHLLLDVAPRSTRGQAHDCECEPSCG